MFMEFVLPTDACAVCVLIFVAMAHGRQQTLVMCMYPLAEYQPKHRLKRLEGGRYVPLVCVLRVRPRSP